MTAWTEFSSPMKLEKCKKSCTTNCTEQATAKNCVDIVFFNRKGDHKRYLAEIAQGEERSELAASSLASFKKALELAKDNVEVLHPVRVAVILNCTSLFYDILHQPKEAEEMIQEVHADT